jgi:hypothetical protein
LPAGEIGRANRPQSEVGPFLAVDPEDGCERIGAEEGGGSGIVCVEAFGNLVRWHAGQPGLRPTENPAEQFRAGIEAQQMGQGGLQIDRAVIGIAGAAVAQVDELLDLRDASAIQGPRPSRLPPPVGLPLVF